MKHASQSTWLSQIDKTTEPNFPEFLEATFLAFKKKEGIVQNDLNVDIDAIEFRNHLRRTNHPLSRCRTHSKMTGRILGFVHRSYQAATTDLYIERLCTSWLLPTWLLSAVRAIFSIYGFTTLLYIIGHRLSLGQVEAVHQSFSYFTVLGYWGLAFYNAFAALHTATYALRGRALLQSWPNPLKSLHSVFYATVTVFPFIVTGMFKKTPSQKNEWY